MRHLNYLVDNVHEYVLGVESRRDIDYAEHLHAACSIVFLRFDLGNPGVYSWLGLAYGCHSGTGRKSP